MTIRRAWLIAELVLFIMLVLVLVAVAAHAHSWYSGLHNEKGELCCGGSDCVADHDPADIEERPDGYFIRSLQVFIPNQRAKPAQVDDGYYHLCYWGHEVKCFFYPPRGY